MTTRFSPLLLLILAWIGLATALPAYAQEKPPHDICRDSCCLTDVLLLNTGYDHINGGLYPVGGADRFWQVISDPAGGTTPRTSDVVPPPPGWPPSQTSSQWISNGSQKQGTVIYQKCFCVCGPDSTDLSFNLSILTASDMKIRVDNISLGSVSTTTVPKTVAATIRVGPGVHCIELEVNNRGKGSEVDVQGMVVGENLVRYTCCNSAIDDGRCKVPQLTIVTDNTWTLTDGPPPTGPYPRCADIVPPSQWSPWGNAISGTNWISATPTGSSQSPYPDYNYRKCFCMEEAGTVVITLTIMADGVCTVYLDGVDIRPGQPFSDWQNPNTYTFIAALDAGCHCFDFTQDDISFGKTGLDVLLDIRGPNISDPACCACSECSNSLRSPTEVGAQGIAGEHKSHATMLAVPNPANSSTTILYKVEEKGEISLALYDAAGNLVRQLHSGEQTAGQHQVTLDAATLSSGTYRAVLKMQGTTSSIPVTVQQ